MGPGTEKVPVPEGHVYLWCQAWGNGPCLGDPSSPLCHREGLLARPEDGAGPLRCGSGQKQVKRRRCGVTGPTGDPALNLCHFQEGQLRAHRDSLRPRRGQLLGLPESCDPLRVRTLGEGRAGQGCPSSDLRRGRLGRNPESLDATSAAPCQQMAWEPEGPILTLSPRAAVVVAGGRGR